MIDLVPGTVVPCVVEKANPGLDAYLVRVYLDDTLMTDKFAILLKSEAVKKYKIGEPLFAAIKRVTKNTIFLSQYTPHYALAMLNMVYADEVKKYDIYFCRFGRVKAGKIKYCKVGVFGRAGLMSFEFLQSLALSKINEITQYLPHPYFIPGHQVEPPRKSVAHNEKFVIEALRPAPVEKIIKYEYTPIPATEGYSKMVLWVPEECVPTFIGKKLRNLVVSFKMTSTLYTVIPVNTELGKCGDPISLEPLILSAQDRRISEEELWEMKNISTVLKKAEGNKRSKEDKITVDAVKQLRDIF